MKSLLVLTLSALLAGSSLLTADNTINAAACPAGMGFRPDFSFLSDAEKTQVKTAHDAAMTANPDLVSQMNAFGAKMQEAFESGDGPDLALMQEGKGLREKMAAAMIKADPTVEPILAKIKSHMHGFGGPGGFGPP